MNELNNISNAINFLNSSDFIRVTLYGDKNFDNVTNFKIITSIIKFIKITKRFEEAFFKLPLCLKYKITSLGNLGNNFYDK